MSAKWTWPAMDSTSSRVPFTSLMADRAARVWGTLQPKRAQVRKNVGGTSKEYAPGDHGR